MPNIYDVARRARVSAATVSAVLNESAFVSPGLKARVQAAVATLGYEPNLLARGVAAPFTAGRELADGEVNAAPAERLRGQVDRGAAVPRPHRFRSIEKGQAHRSASPAPKNACRKPQCQAFFRPAKRFAGKRRRLY